MNIVETFHYTDHFVPDFKKIVEIAGSFFKKKKFGKEKDYPKIRNKLNFTSEKHDTLKNFKE